MEDSKPLRKWTLKLKDRKLSKEIHKKQYNNYLNSIKNKVIFDITILTIFSIATLSSNTALEQEMKTWNIFSVCLRLTLQLIILQCVSKKKMIESVLFIYIFIDTFFVLLLGRNTPVNSELVLFFVNFNAINGWLITLRYKENFLILFSYIFYLTFLLIFLGYGENNTLDFSVIGVALIIAYREYKNKKNQILTEIETMMTMRNLKTQSDVINYLSAGISIIDSEYVYFHNEKMKIILGVKQAQTILKRFKDIYVDYENIRVSDEGDSDIFKELKNEILTVFNQEEFSSSHTKLIKSENEDHNSYNKNNRKKLKVSLHFFLSKLMRSKEIIKKFKKLIIENIIIENKVCELFVDKVTFQNKPCILLGLLDVSIKSHKVFLEDSNIYKDKILGYISHNLNTPLNGIFNFLKIKKFENHDYSYYKKIAVESVNYLIDLKQNITTFTEISTGELNIKKNLIDLKELFKEIYSKYNITCQKRGIQLQLNLEEMKEEEKRICSDKGKLTQILCHLIKNSALNTTKGYIEVKFKKRIKDEMEVRIKDTGIGIEENKLKIIKRCIKDPFTAPFFMKDDDEYLGLGLIICSYLTRILGPINKENTFKINSQKGVGTEISFVLDIYEGNNVSEIKSSSREIVDNPFLKMLKITGNSLERSLSPSRFYEIGKNTQRSSKNDKGKSKFILKRTEKTEKVNKTTIQKKVIKKPLRVNHTYAKTSIKETKINCDCFDILLVDDSDLILSFLAKIFTDDKKYKVKKSYNGQSAFEDLNGKCPGGHRYTEKCKIVITDINMPILNGRELAKIIKEKIMLKEFPFISIVANTANVVENKKNYQEFNDVFGKPVKKNEILNCVAKMMEFVDNERGGV